MTPIVWHAVGMADVPDDDEWLDAREAARFATMSYPKRLSESRLGRWTAKSTAARFLDLPPGREALARVSVRNAMDGAPELSLDGRSAGVAIAMTDRSDWAVTALRRGHERIGCDLEVVEARSPAFVADYFTPAEQALVAAGDHDLMANLIWSAKESALKVLRTGLRRDTRTVEVDLHPADDASDGAWRPFRVAVADGAPQTGWWIRHGAFVLTIASATPSGEPHALDEPSPLAAAVPGHRWMEQLHVDAPPSSPLEGSGA